LTGFERVYWFNGCGRFINNGTAWHRTKYELKIVDTEPLGVGLVLRVQGWVIGGLYGLAAAGFTAGAENRRTDVSVKAAFDG
jgi:hypothetical protein